MGSSSTEFNLAGFMPTLAMVAIQFGFAGLNIVTKLALQAGMNPFVMVTYRQIVATLVTAPLGYFLERNSRLKLTWSIALQILLCALFGATLNQSLYFLGLKYVSPTIACALNNLLPAVTFIMAIPFRMETVGFKTLGGQAKIFGTVLCVGGAMLMTFYKGPQLNLWSPGIHWDIGYSDPQTGHRSGATHFILGSVLVVASCFAWAIWFTLQAKMSKVFAAPYSSTAMLCFVAAIQSAIMALSMDRNLSSWALGWNVRLLAVVYTGVICSGMAFSVMSWCIQRRGPLFVSMFSPLLLIIVAFIGWALFNEKLRLGSVMGSLLIVGGLYGVLWGKGREMKPIDHIDMDNINKVMEMENEDLPIYSITNKGEEELKVDSYIVDCSSNENKKTLVY